MPTQLFLTRLLNAHFAAPATALLDALHVRPAYPQAPITNAFAMELLVFLFLVAYFVVVRVSLSVETPGAVQHLAEMTNEFVSDQSEQIIGHGFERFTGYLTALFLFILLSNLVGLIPGLESPTANVSVPLGFALVTFVYYHYHGIRANGFAYVKQFLGPVWWLYPLLLPIEIISHLARVLSLDGAVVRECVCGRHADAGVFLADSDRDSAGVSVFASGRGRDPGVRVYAAGDDLPVARGGA